MDDLSLVAGFAIAVGMLVVGMWTVSLVSHNVPELQTAPWEIRHHLAAEALMALTLVVGGSMTLAGMAAGPGVIAVGLGMTAYSIVTSSGYYVQRRTVPMVAMFAVLLVLTGAAAIAVVRSLS